MADIPSDNKVLVNEQVKNSSSTANRTFTQIGAGVNFALEQTGNMRIGELFQSVLNETQMALHTSTDVVLCNGQDVTGSTYATLTGTSNVPDMRGYFPRVLDNRLPGLNRDPDSPRTVGSIQQDEYADHWHLLDVGYNIGQVAQVFYTAGSYSWGMYTGLSNSGNSTYPTEANGSITESRPKNISVNFYVRIN